MFSTTILAIGSLKEAYLRAGINEYVKRMSRFLNIEIVELPEYKLPDNPSKKEIDQGLLIEGHSILKRVPKGAKIISLCIEGTVLDTLSFAKRINDYKTLGDKLCFIIGGSNGLDEAVKNASDFKLSLSELTLPHQLARLVLCEQLYRTMCINENIKYHK